LKEIARQLPSQPDVLDVVAENAERAESFEMLDVRCVVVAPDLVAVQPAARAADGAAVAEAGPDPFDRIKAFFESEWFETEQSSPKLRRSLVIYHQRLMETRPAELAAVLEPQHKALTELVAECRAAGAGTLGLDDSTTAAILMQLVITTLQNRVLDFGIQEQRIGVDQVMTLLKPIFGGEGA